jgi:hypothetical protein
LGIAHRDRARKFLYPRMIRHLVLLCWSLSSRARFRVVRVCVNLSRVWMAVIKARGR